MLPRLAFIAACLVLVTGSLAEPPTLRTISDRPFSSVSTPAGELELMMDIVRPVDAEMALPAVVFIHGGGMNEGDRRSNRDAVEAVARAGYVSVGIDYRLMHQGVFPAPLEDCKAALRHLRAHAPELGIDPEKIGVWGHSAGGHLAAMVGVTGPEGAFDPEGEPVPSTVSCVADLSGPTDIARLMRDMMRGMELPPDIQSEMVNASPMTHTDDADPPVLIMHGDADEVIPVSHARDFHDALLAARVVCEYVELEGAGHDILNPEVIGRVLKFFENHLRG